MSNLSNVISWSFVPFLDLPSRGKKHAPGSLSENRPIAFGHKRHAYLWSVGLVCIFSQNAMLHSTHCVCFTSLLGIKGLKDWTDSHMPQMPRMWKWGWWGEKVRKWSTKLMVCPHSWTLSYWVYPAFGRWIHLSSELSLNLENEPDRTQTRQCRSPRNSDSLSTT